MSEVELITSSNMPDSMLKSKRLFFAQTARMPQCHHYFITDHPLQVRYEMSTTAKESWLHSVRLARNTYVDQQASVERNHSNKKVTIYKGGSHNNHTHLHIFEHTPITNLTLSNHHFIITYSLSRAFPQLFLHLISNHNPIYSIKLQHKYLSTYHYIFIYIYNAPALTV